MRNWICYYLSMFIGKVFVIGALVLWFLSRVHKLSRSHVFLLLFIIWSLAFLYSPYWYAFGTFGFPFLKYIAYFLLLLFGFLWVYLSVNKLKIPKFQIHTVPLIALGLILYVINYRQLSSDIAWRGDEGAHVTMVLSLYKYFSYFWGYAGTHIYTNPLFWIFILLLLFVVYKFIRGKGKSIYNLLTFGCILLLVVIPSVLLFFNRAFTDQKNILHISDVIIYPYIQKWLNLFFLVPNFYDISHYRIVPFISLLGISSFLYYNFYRELQSKVLAFFFTLAFSTVPLLLSYSSLLYLEMPLIFLMLVCTWNIKILLIENFNRLHKHYVWYALLLMSFLKETALVFLFIILILRAYYQVYIKYKTKELTRVFIFSELRLEVSVLSPVVIFLFFRKTFAPYFDASHSFHSEKIFSFSNYLVMIQALFDQLGILPILGVLGFIYLSRKDFFITKVITLIVIVMLFFFLTYLNSDYLLIVGYARWNLYFLPFIIFGATTICTFLVNRIKVYGILVLVLIFIFNLKLFPFNQDGSRLSNWGAPLMDVGEYTYPYDEALRFISTEIRAHDILFLGHYSQNLGLPFYFAKYNFYPRVYEYYFGRSRFDAKSERQKLDQYFVALPSFAETLVYHSVNNIDLDMNIVYGGKYIIAKRIRNSENSIYIFIKKTEA